MASIRSRSAPGAPPYLRAVLALLGSILAISAGTTPDSATASPVIPTTADIAAAQRVVAERASRASQLEAQLKSAGADLDRTRIAAEAAGQRYDAALERLAAARSALKSAGRASRAARRDVDAAQRDVGLLVRTQVQTGTGLLPWAVLLGGASPQQILDRASAFNSVSASLDGRLRRLQRARQFAARREAAATQAEQSVHVATAAAAASKQAAEQAAVTAERTVAGYAGRRNSLLVQLAAAQHLSVRLVKQRQEGLEAQALARAEAKRRAAEAALRRREAARQAAEARAAALAHARAVVAAKARAVAAAHSRAVAAARDRAAASARDRATAAARDRATAAARDGATAAARARTEQRLRAGSAVPKRPSRVRPVRHAATTPTAPHSTRRVVVRRHTATTYRARPSARTRAGYSASAAQTAIAYARRQSGRPYVFGATGPYAFDCSGLTMRAWQAAGVSLPRVASSQYIAIRHISASDLRPGDLVFWGSSPGGIYHVAMYLGGGLIIQAPRPGRPVGTAGLYSWIAPTFFGRP